jgi:mono/diheme cytochrome c family protein
MSAFSLGPRGIGITIAALAIVAAGVWQASIVLADDAGPPTPNALVGTNPLLGPVPGVDISGAGPASAIHGNPVAGAAKFHAMCASCHGERGTAGIANPGSDDGTVPTLNPIDPGFLADANGSAAIFARDIDLFVQHGSRPAGKSPLISMPGFGDHKLMPQRDLADIEAFVMELNGVFWPDRCPGIQVELANPSPGARVPVGNYVVAGRAVDHHASTSPGISRIDLFLDARDAGGRFLGSAVPSASAGSSDPTHFQMTVAFPNMVGIHDLVAYAYSSASATTGVVSVPIALGEDPTKALLVVPSDAQSLTCTP